MSKVCQKLKIFELKKIEPSRCLRHRWNKCMQRLPYIFNLYISKKITGKDRRKCIHNIVSRLSAKGYWNFRNLFYPYFPIALHYGYVIIFVNSSDATFATMLFYSLIIFIHAE